MHHVLQEREAFHFFLKDTNCFLGPSVYSYFSFPSARILLSNNFKFAKALIQYARDLKMLFAKFADK